MKFIVNDYLDTYGGSTTLLLRIGEWTKLSNNKLKIYTPKAGNKEIVDKLYNAGVEIEVFNTGDLVALKSMIRADISEECIFISFILKQYMDVETIKKELKESFVNVLYAIHPDTYLKGLGYSNKMAQSVIKMLYKPLISKLNSSGGLMSMDRDILFRTESYYGINLSLGMHIQLLPMLIPNYTIAEMNSKIMESYYSKTLVSACRADFPYKGYVFGLLNDFEKLKEEYADLSLELICSGEQEDVKKLTDKIATLSKKAQASIRYHSWMDYEQLKKLVRKCYLSVGMGTAIIDSAIECVPAIAVKYNSYDAVGDSIFYEKPELLVAYEGKAINQIRRPLDMNIDEYRDVSIKCFDAVKNNYDIEKFFEHITSRERAESKLSRLDVALHKFNSFINSRKKTREYSIGAITKEE